MAEDKTTTVDKPVPPTGSAEEAQGKLGPVITRLENILGEIAERTDAAANIRSRIGGAIAGLKYAERGD